MCVGWLVVDYEIATYYFTTFISEQDLYKHQRSFRTAFHFTVQGVVGTSSGTVWYINWPEKSCVKLVSGHTKEVSTSIRSTHENGNYICVATLFICRCVVWHSVRVAPILPAVVRMVLWLCFPWKPWSS